MRKAWNFVRIILGLLLLAAAAAKGWQLLTEPLANKDIWSYRPFLILQVECEIALGMWLLSGLFKKGAWLASSTCFLVFSVVTFYRGITGAESCGCFGSFHVNPWITFSVVDLPAVAALLVFRPKGERLFTIGASMRYFVASLCIGLCTLAITTVTLASNKPPKVTDKYEVLEPATWVGGKLPILEHIDIGPQLEKNIWVVLLYHHDCPDCLEVIPKYEQIAKDLATNQDLLKITLIEVPPYGKNALSTDSPCTPGCLADTKKWFINTPAAVLLIDGEVVGAWIDQMPDLEGILEVISAL